MLQGWHIEVYIRDSPLVQMVSKIVQQAFVNFVTFNWSLISVLLEVGGMVAGGPMDEYGGNARMPGGHSNVNVALLGGGKC